MAEDCADRDSHNSRSDLRRDRLYAAQGDFGLRTVTPFELGSQENLEAPTAGVQRVDLCRILLSAIGEEVDYRRVARKPQHVQSSAH